MRTKKVIDQVVPGLGAHLVAEDGSSAPVLHFVYWHEEGVNGGPVEGHYVTPVFETGKVDFSLTGKHEVEL